MQWVPSKRVDEQRTGHVFFKDSMSFAWAYNTDCVLNQGYIPSNIICSMWKVIQELFWDNEVVSIRHTLRKRNFVLSHDRYVEIQNRCEDSACHLALLLAPKIFIVLDPPTFRGWSPYEFPTRPHFIWCGSPIRYDGPVSIILNIFLNSCLSAQESGLLCLLRSEVHVPSDCKCHLCQ